MTRDQQTVERLRTFWLAATEDGPSVGRIRFIWMATVEQDTRLSEAARLILTSVARVNVKGGESTFCVKQQTVADRLGLTKKAVGEALRRARHLGWLRLRNERQRGRGYHRADVLELTIPDEIGNSGVTYSDDDGTGASGVTYLDEIGNRSDEIGNRNGQKKVTGDAEIGNRADAVTSENVTPKGLLSRVSLQGSCDALKGMAREDREPSEPQHIGEIFASLFGKQPVQPPLLATVQDDTEVIDAEIVDWEHRSGDAAARYGLNGRPAADRPGQEEIS